MARRRTGRRASTEMSPLLDSDDETLTDVAGWSTGSNEQLRFMVLGGDDALMDKACATILGETENRDTFKFGELKPREAQVCGLQVSVLKTPFYWLEHLKSYFFFSNGVKSLKYDLQFFESMMFPGPHAFLLVHRDVKISGKENYLLYALSDVFGEEVLDYCMSLFIDKARHIDLKQNSTSLKMCGGRYHILHNTDESVNQLFKKTGSMTQRKNNYFFTNHLECFRTAEKYFEAKHVQKDKLINKLRRELNNSKDRESQLKDDIAKLRRQMKPLKDHEEELENKLTETKVKEDSLHERKLDDRERFLDEKLKELEMRERELTQRDARSSEHHQTTEDTAGAELKSIGNAQASGSLETVRRSSMEFNPPSMSQDIDCDKDQKFIAETFHKL